MNELINNCNNCHYQNRPKIPGSQTFNSDLAIVGISPRKNEITQGKPFVGRSGKLLRETLQKAILPINPFITNALLCLPPDDKNIKREAIEACRPRLINELQQVKPKIIIALGNIALHSLTSNYKLKIGNVHSKPLQSELGLIIPIYHPAKILQNPRDYKTFLNGFLYTKRLLTQPNTIKDPGETKYEIMNDFIMDQFIIDINALLNYKGVISCDIETTGLNPKIDKITLVGFSMTKNLTYIFKPHQLKWIKWILEKSKAKFCFHRSQFDTIVLSENGIETESDHDTILQHYCINENEGSHDLKTLARLFLGAENYKSEMETDLPLYLAKDCDYTLQLHNLFLPLIEGDPNLKKLYYQILMPGINLLRRTTQRGFYVDTNYLEEFHNKTQTELDDLKAKVIGTLGKLWNREYYLKQTGAKSAPSTLNPNSHPQLAWIIYDKLRIVPRIKKKVRRSTDKDIIASIIDKHEGFKWLQQYNVKETFMSTYIKGIERKLDNDNRLRSSFSLQTTVTGRLSSSKPNIQNIPRSKDVKNIFVAPEGRLLLEADYKGVELRILAHLSKDLYLIECFEQNRDPHDEMSEEMFGKDFTKEQRVAIKGVNFGAIYGRTAFSIAQEFNIPQTKAQALINNLFRKSPMAKKYLENCEKQLLTGIPFVTPFGRYRRYGVIEGDIHQLNEAKNFTIQSIGSDLTLLSAIALEKSLLEFDAFIVNLVHDSIIIEIPNNKDKVENIIELVDTVMRRTPVDWLQPEIDFPVEISIGFKWGELKEVDIESKQLVELSH